MRTKLKLGNEGPKTETEEGKSAVVLPSKAKKKKGWKKPLIILGVLGAVVYFFVVRPAMSSGRQNASALYQPQVVQRRDITVSVKGTGTVRPVDSYQVTALVRGEVLAAPFEEGGVVEKGSLLYRIDASDAENSVERAALSLEQARLSYQDVLDSQAKTKKNLNITASEQGVIEKLHVKEGDTVGTGTPIADILDRDTMLLKAPFHDSDARAFYAGQYATVIVDGTAERLDAVVSAISATSEVGAGGTLLRMVTFKVQNPGALSADSSGSARIGDADCAQSANFEYGAKRTVTAKAGGEVERIYVKEGDRVSEGQLIASLPSESLEKQLASAKLNRKNAELSLESARNQLDSYTITSPISGTVIEKKVKAGDNIETNASASNYLAVIYDMSALKFEMNIDELDIGKVRVSQRVSISAGALEGQKFTGVVDKVNINGVTSGGVTVYPVTVLIEEPRDLLPGMNIDAEIIAEEVLGALTVTVDAVSRGNTVLVPTEGAIGKDGVIDGKLLERREVQIGRNDERHIEILSGLSEGETVVSENRVSGNTTGMFSMGGGQSGQQGQFRQAGVGVGVQRR